VRRRRRPFLLGPEPTFPDPELADESGFLAVGGDLSPERLLEAYRRGIFPWPHDEDLPLFWFSPDPRCVLYPAELHVGRTLRSRLARYEVRYDTAFAEVIRGCATAPRPTGDGTWITPPMVEAYFRLHEAGFAHSIESWREGRLAGGLYGVSLGGVFFGESMFAREPDASKVALVHLVRRVAEWGFRFVDCQLETDHLARFGARAIPRARFLRELARALEAPTRRGSWDP
jgi:leucyl/phenylalanyl-tRNA--protein transferase